MNIDTSSTPAMLDTSTEAVYASKTFFHAVDYVVFGAMLLVSAAIGIYFAIQQKRKKFVTTDDYLMGGRQMSFGPITMSLIASFMSSVTILGVPAEYYVYGTMFTWFIIPYALLPIIIGWIYMPVFYDLGISSTYEYLEKRFSRATRLITTFMYLLLSVLYGGIVVYGPALALSEVTGFGMWMAILVTGFVCIFYTTLGGLKAVIWTDVFQAVIMITGFIAVIIQGSINLGGFGNIWQAAKEGGRIDFIHFEIDPRVRNTFWSILFGGGVFWLGVNGVNQSQVQRYVSCKSKKEAKIAIVLNGIGLIIILVLAGMTGLTIFATYRDCDPLNSKKIGKSDQLFPYIVMDILAYLPGIPGLFVAGIYSSSLSTISSGMNAMACVTLEDFIRPNTDWKASSYTWFSRILVLVYGISYILFAYLASILGGLIRMAYSIHGIINGPIVGLFTLGMMMPFVNGWGALIGVIAGWATTTMIFIGSAFYPSPPEFIGVLPRSIEGCPETTGIEEITQTASISNFSMFSTVSNSTAYDDDRPAIAELFALSYLYVAGVGCLVTMVVGILVSACTGFTKKSPPANELLCSWFHSVRDDGKPLLERSSSWFPPTAQANAKIIQKYSDSSLTFRASETKPLKPLRTFAEVEHHQTIDRVSCF